MNEREKNNGPCEGLNKVKRNHTFLTGIYMAINAISNSFLIMDGPDCAYKKIELFEKNHDYYSHIFRRDGKHKIGATITDVNHVIDDRHDQIESLLLSVASQDGAEVVFISSEPMVMLTGIDYNMITASAQKKTKIPIIPVPYKSLDLDWLDGYSSVMEAIARKIDISNSEKKENTIAIVGYLFDRNEGDHVGNIMELKRMLEEISIDVSSIWLSGSNFNELINIENAKVIVSMPYAGETSRILAEKTGAKVIDVNIPFGLSGTRDWFLKIADEFGKKDSAEKLIKKEMDEALPILEWIAPTFFQNKKYSIISDPFFAEAINKALNEIDMKMLQAIIYSTKSRKNNISFIEDNVLLFFELDDLDIYEGSDFIIGNSNCRIYFQETYVEIGFPSYGTHFLATTPFLGIRGFLLFLNRMINDLKPD